MAAESPMVSLEGSLRCSTAAAERLHVGAVYEIVVGSAAVPFVCRALNKAELDEVLVSFETGIRFAVTP